MAGGALLVAGATKLARPIWVADAAALGVSWSPIRFLPVVEVAVGALLAAGIARPVVGAAAAVLYAGFTVLLVRRLRSGSRPVCACFGGFSRRPISWWSVVRNVVLTGCALAAIR